MRKYIYIFISIIGISSCSLFDNEDPIPAYLILDNPSLSTLAEQGANTHNITDVWVFDDQELLGIFPLPAKVPIIADGNEHTVTIFAGVRNNGVQSNSLRYPFMKPVVATVNLVAQEEKVIPLNFTYAAETKFDLVEDFEGPHEFVTDPAPIDGEVIEITSEEVKSGNGAGHVLMAADTSRFERTTLGYYPRSQNAGIFTFVELDYKSDVPFLVGYIIQTDQVVNKNYTVLVKPSDTWKKIYIDLSTPIGASNVVSYTMTLASSVTSSDSLPANIYFDNIKLLHF